MTTTTLKIGAGLKIGDSAPDFVLKDKDGKVYSLESFASKNLVLFFYPKDNTPGCTIESKAFSKDLARFKKLETEVIGISGGDEKTKSSFCKKHKLLTTLLSDTDFEIAKKYGSYGEKKFLGKTFKGIYRKTFVIGKDRTILIIFDKVTPKTHSAEVLKFLGNL